MDSKTIFSLCHEDVFVALRELATESVDLVFADPPYFLSNDGFTVKSGKMVSVNKGAWDKSLGFQHDYDFHLAWIKECLRILKPNGSLFISGTYHSIYQCGFAVQQCQARIINEIIWFKPNGAPALAGRNFTASHESIIWAAKSQNSRHTFNYAESKSWPKGNDVIRREGKQMRSVWSISSTPPSEKKLGSHPTQKPIELLKRIILLASNEGDVILDPFCGSGTTGVVSVSNGRSFIGIDCDEDYINLARRRIAEANEESQYA
jgi:site-specific DNA-methyltransferase (adenine-specific)